jgi:hypothetical protein
MFTTSPTRMGAFRMWRCQQREGLAVRFHSRVWTYSGSHFWGEKGCFPIYPKREKASELGKTLPLRVGAFCALGDRLAQFLFQRRLFVDGMVFQSKHVFDIKGIDCLFTVGRDHCVGDIDIQ